MTARGKTTPASTPGSFTPATGAKSRARPTLPTPTQDLIHAVRAGCGMDFCKAEGHMFCSPDHAEPIKAYSLRVTGTLKTRDGAAWTGIIHRDGQPVMEVENSGTGGPNSYHALRGGDFTEHRAELNRFVAASEAAAPRLTFEQVDCVVGFLDLIANT